MDKYIGRLLDNRYEILEVIGSGGMAVVYKARCHRLNRLVAIKILKEENFHDEEFRRRFHAESQAVAMLSHPNIVSVYDVSTSDEADYIVMELIDGITLKQYMEKKGVLNWKETLHFSLQIAKALEHAHGRGIIHRDIKPHNVMVLKNGSVKVADFGIARVMSKSNTLTKEALGSVHYISPEQAKGGRVDNRSDIYSLGVVMYEMMTGRPPYDGESPVAVAIQHINGGAVMPSTLNPNIPGGLEQIIMKAMAHDPAGRYTNATAMLYHMDEFRKDPTILFENDSSDGEDLAVIRTAPPVQEPQPPKTTAERVAAKNDPPKPRRQPRPAQQPTRRPRKDIQRYEEDDSYNRIATIAIVTCSIVAVIAIGIFIFTLINGGLFSPPQLVEVPNLLGQNIDNINLNSYPNFEFEITRESSDQYEKGYIMKQTPDGGDQIEKGKTIYLTVSSGTETKTNVMPADLVGRDKKTAEQFLKDMNAGLKVVIREEVSDLEAGLVSRTEPAAGEELTNGQAVVLWISKGPSVENTRMPYVVGQTEAMAKQLLNNSKLKNVEVIYVESERAAGEVVSQSVARNSEIPVDTLIQLEVSKGPSETQSPTTGSDDPTDPPEGSVEKIVTIELPEGFTENYLLSLKTAGGSWVVEDMEIMVGTKSIQLTLTGKGVVDYQMYINGRYIKSFSVDYDIEE